MPRRSAERGGDAGRADRRGLGRCGRDRQHRAGIRAGQVGGGATSERGEKYRIVLAQQRPQLVGCLGAPPGGVLVRTSQHRDRAGQLAVGWQCPVHMGVRAQDVGQGHRVDMVALLPRYRMPLPVSGHGHWVDRVDPAAGGAQGRDQQPARALDRHRDRVVDGVACLRQQHDQLPEPFRTVRDAPLGDQRPIGVDHRDVMVLLGSIDSAIHLQSRCPPDDSVSAMALRPLRERAAP